MEDVVMVFEKIQEIIVNNLSVEADAVKMETNLIEDLGADSLDAVEIVMAVEDQFDIEVSDEDIEKMATVGDIVEYVQAKLG